MVTPDERSLWLFNCNLSNRRDCVNDSFCPNGGYSETRKIGERKNVDT
jgi:hypothetical protein